MGADIIIKYICTHFYFTTFTLFKYGNSKINRKSIFTKFMP